MKSYRHFYADGRFESITGTGAAPLIDPSTGCGIGEVALCGAADIERAVNSARHGFEVWSASSLGDRKSALARLRKELEDRADRFASALAEEMGCPVWLGKLMQVPMPLKDIEFTLEGIDRIHWQETIGNGLVERVPSGVVAAITPWNFPLHQIVAKVAAAVAAGCSVVLKPSEMAPGAALLFVEAIHACGLPPGVVNMVFGDSETGRLLVSHSLVDRISFTGSTAVGRRIMATAAEGLKPVTLELGGKSAAVLLDDAELDAAMPTIFRMCMANSGQACVSQSRLIAPHALIPRIVALFRELRATWPLGDPRDETTRLGPVATEAQHLHVTRMIERAQADGATLAAGGAGQPSGLPNGWYVEPTLFTGVRPDMELASREVFGPVLALLGYSDEDEALALANGTPYGLSGAVWSKDAGRATGFARKMRTGQVVINGAAQNLATPFGGWGQSGFGRENGRFGIEDLLNYRALHGASE